MAAENKHVSEVISSLIHEVKFLLSESEYLDDIKVKEYRELEMALLRLISSAGARIASEA